MFSWFSLETLPENPFRDFLLTFGGCWQSLPFPGLKLDHSTLCFVFTKPSLWVYCPFAYTDWLDLAPTHVEWSQLKFLNLMTPVKNFIFYFLSRVMFPASVIRACIIWGEGVTTQPTAAPYFQTPSLNLSHDCSVLSQPHLLVSTVLTARFTGSTQSHPSSFQHCQCTTADDPSDLLQEGNDHSNRCLPLPQRTLV